MNMIKGAVITILASGPCIVQGQNLRAASTNWNENEEQVTDNDRQLQYHEGGVCYFDGKSRYPGQWLEGPTESCMCDRYGSSKWVKCVKHDATAADTGGADLTALGKRQKFQAKDFVFDLLGQVPVASSEGGTVQTLTVANLPSLAGQGVAFTLINIQPCGLNLPHSHPRATELLFVISGKGLRTAFVEENPGRVIVNDIGTGETTFFPEGLIHYQQNLSCQPITYISALNSEDPGVVGIVTQFFDLPKEAIVTALNQQEAEVNKLIAGLPEGPAEGRSKCMEKCGLAYTW